jgi:hypothetical protein
MPGRSEMMFAIDFNDEVPLMNYKVGNVWAKRRLSSYMNAVKPAKLP